MTMTLSTAARTGICDALVTAIGSSGKMKIYNGTKPASLGAPAGTLLATLTRGTTAGTTSAALATSAASRQRLTSTARRHSSGSPLRRRWWPFFIDTGGAGNLTFTGTVVSAKRHRHRPDLDRAERLTQLQPARSPATSAPASYIYGGRWPGGLLSCALVGLGQDARQQRV
jgi:hypothetical protein